MKRLNVHQFYRLGSAIHPLSDATIKEGTKVGKVVMPLLNARLVLKRHLQFLPPLSRDAAEKLLRAIYSVLPEKYEDFPTVEEQPLNWAQVYSITNGLREFETILAAELPTLTTYIIDQKAAYSTPDIVENAEIIFTKEIRKSLGEAAIEDIRQAGRALAFDLFTAAGFHIVRATESVIRRYYAVVVGSKPKKRDWGAYIVGLRGKGADDKIVAAIDQMRSLHRNPLLHPEDVLSEEDALGLFGIAQSAIIAILGDMTKRLAPTGEVAGLTPPPEP